MSAPLLYIKLLGTIHPCCLLPPFQPTVLHYTKQRCQGVRRTVEIFQFRVIRSDTKLQKIRPLAPLHRRFCAQQYKNEERETAGLPFPLVNFLGDISRNPLNLTQFLKHFRYLLLLFPLVYFYTRSLVPLKSPLIY